MLLRNCLTLLKSPVELQVKLPLKKKNRPQLLSPSRGCRYLTHMLLSVSLNLGFPRKLSSKESTCQ